jgi:hypothetical protein
MCDRATLKEHKKIMKFAVISNESIINGEVRTKGVRHNESKSRQE